MENKKEKTFKFISLWIIKKKIKDILISDNLKCEKFRIKLN
jgi:hypothetical protein